MKHAHDVLRARLLAPVIAAEQDLAEYMAAIAAMPEAWDLARLERTEWSPDFERLMRNRLMLGSIRYGRLGSHGTRGGKPLWDYVTNAIAMLQEFKATGNVELLVDSANACLLEYVDGRHPLRHFQSADGGGHFTLKD